MNTRPFRFGVSLLRPGSSREWSARARQAEDQGYDVIQSADHVGIAGPFPGAGKRILDLAARTTDIISLPIAAGIGEGTPEEELGDRVERVRRGAGDRDVELLR